MKLPNVVVQEAIDRSDVILTELKIDSDMQAKAMAMMMLPPGKKLSKMLPEEVQKRVVTKLIPMAAVDNMKVWALTMNLMVLHARELFLSGRQPMDLDDSPRRRRKAPARRSGALENPGGADGNLRGALAIEDQIRMLTQDARHRSRRTRRPARTRSTT